MGQELYRQVRLRNDQNAIDTCWIPASFARVGKRIKIDGKGTWIVEEAYEGTKTADEAEHRSVTKRFQEVLD